MTSRKSKKRVDWTRLVQDVCSQSGIQQRQRNSANEWAHILRTAMDSIEEQSSAIQGSEKWDRGKPVNILEDIILATNYKGWLVKDEGEETTENSRVSNVVELVRASRRFPTVKEFLDFIDELTEASKGARRKGKKPNKVVLTTCHRSKGLEWENVFVIGVSDKVLPHGRCEDIEEERRLYYVAVTRAKQRLSVSCVEEIALGTRIIMTAPSPFIYESGLEPEIVERKSEIMAPPPILEMLNEAKMLSSMQHQTSTPLFDDLDEDFDEDSLTPSISFKH